MSVRDKVVADTKARSVVAKEALRPFNFEESQLSLEYNSWVQVLFLSPLLLCWSIHARFQLQAPVNASVRLLFVRPCVRAALVTRN